MMKFIRSLLVIVVLATLVKAQEPKLILMERSTAIDLYNKLDKGTITFSNPDGRVVAIWVRDDSNQSLRDALQTTLGDIKPQPITDCKQIHRGEECTGDARGVRR